jgi:hypothetical protein
VVRDLLQKESGVLNVFLILDLNIENKDIFGGTRLLQNQKNKG